MQNYCNWMMQSFNKIKAYNGAECYLQCIELHFKIYLSWNAKTYAQKVNKWKETEG